MYLGFLLSLYLDYDAIVVFVGVPTNPWRQWLIVLMDNPALDACMVVGLETEY